MAAPPETTPLQAPPNATFVSPSVAKVFVDRLYRDIKGAEEIPEISVTPKNQPNADSVKLTSHDLSSFGNFLQFLHNNKTMVDGEQVVYAANEQYPEGKASEIGTIYPVMIGKGRANNRQVQTQRFSVNRTALRKLLNHMKEEAEKPDNNLPTFSNVYIDTMIFDFNNYFRDSKLAPVKRKHQISADEFNLDTIVDNVPNYIFYPQKPRYGINTTLQGQYPITLKNVSSNGNFNEWMMSSAILNLQDSDVNVKDYTPEAGKGYSYMRFNQLPPEDIKKNKCILLSILLDRAEFYKQSMSSKQLPAANEYYKSVYKLMAQNNCSISGTTTVPTEPDKVPGQPDKESLTSDKLNILEHITSQENLPLSRLEIDMKRIDSFVSDYIHFLALVNNREALRDVNINKALIDKYRDTIDREIMKPGIRFNMLNLETAPDAATHEIKHVADFKNYMDYLQAIVMQASKVAWNLDKYYGKKLPPNRRNNLQAQFGSVLMRNNNRLSQFSNSLKQRVLPKR